jgi:hypothetical protein
MNKTILLAGIGALAYYIYTRLDEEQKDSLVKGVKDQLNKTMEQFMPRNSKANYETRMDNLANGRSDIEENFSV